MKRHDDNFEWINGKRILKDHGRLRVPMYFRDGRINPNLTDVQRAVATNRPLIDCSGHRPGFAFVNDAATREARARMYALKDVEYENAWRGLNATCPSCSSGEADDGSECETCCGEGILNPSFEANAEEAYRNTATHHESLPRRIDHRSVDQMVRDHRAHMASIYAAYNYEMSEAWRRS
jgi:hypothetical protein